MIPGTEQPIYSTIQGKRWYDPLSEVPSQLGARGTPSLGQFDSGEKNRRWEWDPAVNAYVVSNLSPEDYDAKFSPMNKGHRDPVGSRPSVRALGGF